MATSFSSLHVRALHYRTLSSTRTRADHDSKSCALHLLYPRLVLLRASYSSYWTPRFSGMPFRRTTSPPKWYSGTRILPCAANLSNDSLVQDDPETLVDGYSPPLEENDILSVDNQFRGNDGVMSSLDGIIDEPGLEPSCEDEARLRNAVPMRSGKSMTWFQEHFVKVVGPIVRILSGAHLNKPQSDTAERDEWQDEERMFWIPLKVLTGSIPPDYHRRRIGRILRQAEADFFVFTSHLGMFCLIMMATGTILATGLQLAGGDLQLEKLLWCSWLGGIIVGSMMGAEKVMERRVRSGPRNVVITGSTRGLGKALAREFLIAGDRVVIASRSHESVAETVKELQKELNSKLLHPFAMETSAERNALAVRAREDRPRVIGMACDVSKVADVRTLASYAADQLGSIDIWINNAGMNKGFRPLVQFSDDDITQIVSANLIGSLLCTREAIRVMKTQPKGGHIFNMDGAGSGGSSTPLTAVYGATKCGLRQLHASVLKECKRSRVGIHTASPGMVLTDLLLSGASLQNKKMFNIICELPETVARTLVPRMREIKGTGKAINFLTPPRILLALITAWLRRGRWFDEEGQAVYAAEADRLRNWAEDRTRLPLSAAVDQFSDTTLFSVFSITVICAFIMLSTSGSGLPGT